MIVIVSAPARTRGDKLLDGVILCMCATTGVFAIALAPLLFLFRRWRGPDAVARWVLVVFSGAAALQLFSIGYLQHHLPAGYNAAPRVAIPLHPSPQLFFEILGRRVVMQPLGLESSPLAAVSIELIGLLGAVAAVAALRRGAPELRLFLLFAGALLVMGLVHPLGVDWPGMAGPVVSGRYFLVPEYAMAALIVWHVARANRLARRVAASILVMLFVVAVPSHWSYAPLQNRGFAAEAAAFESSPSGTRMVFPLDPTVPAGVWHMTLVRQ
ncbi:MAG TPA: hypothetical protein VG165_16545 [Solirubrobacteraceae bacterium]|nr:hypothetical protein [Solirubrobacteraceae bacterium]